MRLQARLKTEDEIADMFSLAKSHVRQLGRLLDVTVMDKAQVSSCNVEDVVSRLASQSPARIAVLPRALAQQRASAAEDEDAVQKPPEVRVDELVRPVLACVA